MNSLFASPGHSYGAETVMFVASVVLFTLPLWALFVASVLEPRLRDRSRRGALAPAPLALRRFKVIKEIRSL